MMPAIAGPVVRWNAVLLAMNNAAGNPPAYRARSAHHVIGHAWTYTMTFEFRLAGEYVRCHVHYTPNAMGGYNIGPGNYWAEGIVGQSAPTPAWVVNMAPAQPDTCYYGNFHGDIPPDQLYETPK